MFLLRDINPLSLKLLNRIYRESRHHQVRQTAQVLILVSQNIKNKNLMEIFKVSYKTMYNWLNRWEYEGMLGLYNKPGRGRKETFNSAQSDQIRDWVKLIYTIWMNPDFAAFLVSLMDGKILVNICQLTVVELSV